MRQYKTEIKDLLEKARSLAKQDRQELLQYIVAMALVENCPAHGGDQSAPVASNDNTRM